MSARIVLIILFCISSFFSRAQTSEDQCDSLITRGVKLMLEGEHARSLEILMKARDIANQNRWHRQHFLAVNNIGANYYSMLDIGEALDNYLKAYTIAIKELDEKHEMIVLNNIAILYLKENKIDQAEEYFTKAYTIATENRDAIKIGFYAVNLGLVANKKNELKKAKSYFDQAIPLLHTRPDIIQKAYLGRAEYLLLTEQYPGAKEILMPLAQLEGNINRESKNFALQLLSQIAYKEKNFEEARNYSEALLEKGTDAEVRLDAFKSLAKIYTDAGNYSDALAAKDSVLKASEELFALKNGRLFETNRVKFEIQNFQNQLREKEEKLKEERKLFYLILITSLIMIVLFIWALRNTIIKGKQRKMIHDRSRELMELALEKEKTDRLLLEKKLAEEEARALLEEERLKNEIESRNRKLSAKALHLSERNQMLTSLIEELEDVSGIQQQSKMKAYIKRLKDLSQTDKEWEQFVKHFEEVNQGLLGAIKERHPDLNANDIRFISYLYMNLSTKEIANILSITNGACRKRKERIARKMELSDGSLLYDYISEFRP